MLGPEFASDRQSRPSGKLGGREIRDRWRNYRRRQPGDQTKHVRGMQGDENCG